MRAKGYLSKRSEGWGKERGEDKVGRGDENTREKSKLNTQNTQVLNIPGRNAYS